MSYTLVITQGTVVDGTGGEPYAADIAVTDGRIAAIAKPGELAGVEAETVIDATGLVVTPGFVDIHTHYDGQVTWDPMLTPSCWHGVTTVVMGNCGVGFAPVTADKREWLIGLMEGVEDIPGAALSTGIQWAWQSFPQYLDALDALPLAIDVGTQVPHGAVRAYVMGEGGAKNEPAAAEDIAMMAKLVREGIEAGALGFSTSRTIVHRAVDGEPVPGTFAAEDELFGIGKALAAAGTGVFELAPAGIMGEDLAAPDRELDWMLRLAERTGRTVSFGLLQHDGAPDDWKRLLDTAGRAFEAGVPLRPQVSARPLGLLTGLQTFNPFSFRPSYLAAVERSNGDRNQLVRELRKPEVRAAVLTETDTADSPLAAMAAFIGLGLDRTFMLGDPPEYEPAPDTSLAYAAQRAGREPFEYLYDLLLSDEGRALFFRPLLNYSEFTHDPIREMLAHPASAVGLGDGGAHVGAICDASNTTFMLTHWARDRVRGQRIPLATAVRKMTKDTADMYGLTDRGVIAVGKKADLNVIDFENLRLKQPAMAYDLPGGARRLLQRADGYRATIVSGQIILRDGEETGARPGALVRGAR
ncbi:N-acyl-D-amino-acid deacylase family protein [Nocardia huaxiensis]|uniref:Amidohydrolase family protein n=1 Tax=Nocardia huaxiensis TaxID=2755382 RepID=A0A7D6VHD1_9NOCA|nr:amidohydrolase family protein [Nocardia huaxiensis]QLY32837.1 amidohydrolase family protein [Nocardia huaxiensis]UFS93416.1 amidohydrolase family protein [Nocardia huaxiensis]